MTDADTHGGDDALPFVDQPAPPRAEERLDEPRLEAWLREHLDGFDGPLEVRQFPKGHSNLTYWISDGRSQWVLRRPPFGSHVKTAHDMGREYRVLSGLHRVYPPAPRAFAHCDDLDVIGAPFYVMERVEGIVLRRDPPRGLTLDEDTAHRLCERFVRHLARIHGADLEAAGLTDFGQPEGYIERQITGWTKRYAGSQTDDLPAVDDVAAWLAAHLPREHEGCLIHNDFKFDNLVLDPHDPTRIIGVLDWEMSTLGHPLMDLGTTLSYWVDPEDPPPFHMFRFGPTTLPGMFDRRDLVAHYGEVTGRAVDGIDFYYVYGLFKTAVVAQQIYYRYKTGKTADARFAVMIEGVRLLSQWAAGVAERSSL
jgi:aminoglycoside phosphotransferase (APT) family kinase protein